MVDFLGRENSQRRRHTADTLCMYPPPTHPPNASREEEARWYRASRKPGLPGPGWVGEEAYERATDITALLLLYALRRWGGGSEMGTCVRET